MSTSIPRSHKWLDGRSLLLHRAVADRIRRAPTLLAVAFENLDRWERRHGFDAALDEWRRLLKSEPLDLILALLEEESDNADRLRQSSPFPGILSEKERLDLMKSYEAKRA